jgi:hypothetical protein
MMPKLNASDREDAEKAFENRSKAEKADEDDDEERPTDRLTDSAK